MARTEYKQPTDENDDLFAAMFEGLVSIAMQMREEREHMKSGIVSDSTRFNKIKIEPLDS